MAAPARRLVDPVPVPGFRHGRDHALGTVLLRRARGGDALPEHGAPGPAALGRRRGQLAALDPFGGSVRGGRAGPVQLHGAARASRESASDASAEQLHTLSSESTDLVKNIPADRPVLIQVYYSPEVPREYRRDQGRPAGAAQGVRGPERRQDPLEPGADRAVLDRGARGGEAVRDRAAPGVFRRPGQADVVRGLPGRRLHVGRRGSRHPVLRPRPAGRVRADPLDPRRVEERPQEGRHPDHRRQADRRNGHADLQPDAGMVDRHRAQEAVRRQLGLARHADLVRPERPPGGPAVVADPETDRQPDRLHQEGRSDPALPRPVPGRQSVDVARAAQDAAGRPVRRRPAPRAQGRPASAARPGRARLAVDRDRLERLQSAPQARRPAIDARDRLHRQGERRRRRIQRRSRAPARAFRRSSRSSPACSGPRRASGTEFIPLLRTGTTGGTVPWSDVVQQSFMGISGINPRRRHIPTGKSYTLAARLTGQVPADAKADKTKDADKKDAKKKDEASAARPRSTSSRSPTST